MFEYYVYGILLRSEYPLPLPEYRGNGYARIDLSQGTAEEVAAAIVGATIINPWDGYRYADLPNGGSYLHWREFGELIVAPDGSRVLYVCAADASDEAWQTHVLGPVLSFAFVKAGYEPLHGTAIEHNGRAIALLGDTGYGKSTLAAGLLRAGGRLLTDDLLLLRAMQGELFAYPGPPRIKLYPEVAHKLLRSEALGVPMNAQTNKYVVPLRTQMVCDQPTPLSALYLLDPIYEASDWSMPRIEVLLGTKAFQVLIQATFNRRLAGRARSEHILRQTTELARSGSVRKLSYPHFIERLPEVCTAILDDIALLTES